MMLPTRAWLEQWPLSAIDQNHTHPCPISIGLLVVGNEGFNAHRMSDLESRELYRSSNGDTAYSFRLDQALSADCPGSGEAASLGQTLRPSEIARRRYSQ
jgi:hypothetical protein